MHVITPNNEVELIVQNRKIHNSIAPFYEGRHVEIFNPTEQRRIREILRSAVTEVDTGSLHPLRVLDYGAGTGNLSKHLLELGTTVVASDVSEGCIRELQANLEHKQRLETVLINGSDLAQYSSASFDMVATYSVLHHVPDYLAIIDEFIRVLKPGGIIYIDHEVCPSFWENIPEYLAYNLELTECQKNLSDNIMQTLLNLLKRKDSWRYMLAILRQKNNRLDEGDIHVYKHDHIDWSAIMEHLKPYCGILTEEDYLVCREKQDPPYVWSRWHGRCVDMRLVVARKK